MCNTSNITLENIGVLATSLFPIPQLDRPDQDTCAHSTCAQDSLPGCEFNKFSGEKWEVRFIALLHLTSLNNKFDMNSSGSMEYLALGITDHNPTPRRFAGS